MKQFILTALLLTFAINSYSQVDWSYLNYFKSSGPVSPEYQYSYVILIKNDRDAHIEYKKFVNGKDSNTYAPFKISKKNFKKLVSLINKSKILEVDLNTIKADKYPIGGKTGYLTVTYSTILANPTMPDKVLTVPTFVKEEYAKNITKLYTFIEKLVPKSAWKKVKI
jgi:hypothetical protein